MSPSTRAWATPSSLNGSSSRPCKRPQALTPPRRREHRHRQDRHCNNKRVRVGLDAERRVDQLGQQRTDCHETKVEAGALEDVPHAEDRAEREPEEHYIASSAAFTSA